MDDNDDDSSLTDSSETESSSQTDRLKKRMVAPGDKIGNIVFDERIAVGGFGEVFSAHYAEAADPTPNLAVKVLSIKTQKQKDAFNREKAITQFLKLRDDKEIQRFIEEQRTVLEQQQRQVEAPDTITTTERSRFDSNSLTPTKADTTTSGQGSGTTAFESNQQIVIIKSLCYQLNANINEDNSGVVCQIGAFAFEDLEIGFLIFPLIQGIELFDSISDEFETLFNNANSVVMAQQKVVSESKTMVEKQTSEQIMVTLKQQLENAKQKFNNTLHGLVVAGRLDLWLKTCLVIARKLYQVVNELHSLRIYHRDIKPENIVIQNLDFIQTEKSTNIPNNLSVLLLDFGLSCAERFSGDTVDPILKCNNFETTGTFGYIDVEQIAFIARNDGKRLKDRTQRRNFLRLMDLHAVGVTVYQMLNDNEFTEFTGNQFAFKKLEILGSVANWGKYGQNFSDENVIRLNDLVYSMTDVFANKKTAAEYIKDLDFFIGKL